MIDLNLAQPFQPSPESARPVRSGDRPSQHIEAIARRLFGAPNPDYGSDDDIRFGTYGSLSVKPSEGVWHSHEEHHGGGVRELLEWQGIARDDQPAWLEREIGLRIDPPKRGGDITAVYDYRNAAGEVVYQVCRIEKPGKKKTFSQRRPDGKGGWIWDTEGVERVPYQLPELLEAPAGSVIDLCEGEKDADNLRAAGGIATTNVGGAGYWEETYNQYFAGHHLVMHKDNDEAGERRMHTVGAQLKAIVASLRVVSFPDQKKGFDVSDWLALGHTAEELHALAQDFESAPQQVIPPANNQSRQVQRRNTRTVAPNAAIGGIVIGELDNWEQNLIRAGNGDPQAIQVNVAYALAASPELAGKLWYNQFSHTIDVYGALPWNPAVGPRAWDETDHFCLISWCQGNPMINANTAITKGAVHQVSHMQDYDPLLQMIDGTIWDGNSRLDDCTLRLLDTDDTPYVRAVGRKFIIAMVRRARRPGVKADNVLILYGDEGLGKSSIFEALATKPFFTDDIADLGSKDAAMQLRGKWLIEMSDLENLNRVEGLRANAWFSRSADRFRPPYGQMVIEQLRRSLVVGTTNEDEVLQHATGLRRYWVIAVRKADVAGMTAERAQLIAEAAHYEAKGEAHWLQGCLVEAQRESAQQHRVADSWRSTVIAWIDLKTDQVKALGFSAREVLEFALKIIDLSKWNRSLEMRAVRVLKDLGYTEKVHDTDGNRWRKPQRSHRLGD